MLLIGSVVTVAEAVREGRPGTFVWAANDNPTSETTSTFV